MTTDSETMEQYLTFVRSRFLIYVLIIGITADKNHIIFASPAATVILQNKRRFLREKPRNPDKTKKPRSSGKNPAVVILFWCRRSRPQSRTELIFCTSGSGGCLHSPLVDAILNGPVHASSWAESKIVWSTVKFDDTQPSLPSFCTCAKKNPEKCGKYHWSPKYPSLTGDRGSCIQQQCQNLTRRRRKGFPHRQQGPLQGSSSPLRHFKPARVKPN